jgi:Transglutaminase-like superfamily
VAIVDKLAGLLPYMTFPSTSFWHKFFRLSWPDRLLLFETMFWLAIARLAVEALPFRYVARMAALRLRHAEPPLAIRTITARRIRWAIAACARRVPWRALCFEQGLAAQFMLRRRGIPSVLFYGAAPDDQRGLAAHVWVRDGDIDVIGCDIASRFAILATFPPAP